MSDKDDKSLEDKMRDAAIKGGAGAAAGAVVLGTIGLIFGGPPGAVAGAKLGAVKGGIIGAGSEAGDGESIDIG